MKHVGLVFLVLITLIPGLSARTQIVSMDSAVRSSGSAEITVTPSGPVVLFDSLDGTVSLSRKHEDIWVTLPVAQGTAGGITAVGPSVVFGYTSEGKAYAAAHDIDAGFLSPEAVSPYQESAGNMALASDVYGLYSIHLTFDRRWTHSFSYAENPDSKFLHIGNFPGSAGYSQQAPIHALHGNLYSAFQDSSRDFAVFLACWSSTGDYWNYTELTREHSWAVYDIAPDPLKPERVYAAVLSEAGLSVFRIEQALSSSPAVTRVFHDQSIIQQRSRIKQVRTAVLENGTVLVFYQEQSGDYMVITSRDRAESWNSRETIGNAVSSGYITRPGAAVSGNSAHFTFLDGRGSVHYWSTSEEFHIYREGDGGIIQIPSISSRVSIYLSDTNMILFSAPESGTFNISVSDPAAPLLYLSLFETQYGTLLVHNDRDDFLSRSISLTLEKGELYMLGIGVMDEADIGKMIHLEVYPFNP